MVKTYSACTKKPELLNDILEETEELIKIYEYQNGRSTGSRP